MATVLPLAGLLLLPKSVHGTMALYLKYALQNSLQSTARVKLKLQINLNQCWVGFLTTQNCFAVHQRFEMFLSFCSKNEGRYLMFFCPRKHRFFLSLHWMGTY